MDIRLNAEKSIKRIYINVKSSGFSVTNIEQKKFNFEFSAVKNNCKNKIQVYFGKKGIKTVVQGNDSSSEYINLKNIIAENLSFEFEEKEEENYNEYIGTDESGKGDFFGPLVVAGFYFNDNVKEFLLTSEVKDSKELSDYAINKIADQIIKKFPNHYHILSINPSDYNRIYLNFKNINEILNWAHSEVIKVLYNSHKTKTIIIDQFSKRDISIQYSKDFSDVDFIQIPKAEKYIGVAAASIIARSRLNRWFDDMKSNNLNLPKGASSIVESAAKSLVTKIGRDKLGQYAKLHFKTFNKILND